MKRVIDRLILFQQSMKKTIGGQNKFEAYIGLSAGYISKMDKNSGGITSDVMLKLKDKFPDLNFDWLITGNGSMLKTASAEVLLSSDKEQEYKNTIKELETEIVALKAKNEVLRELVGLGERKDSKNKSA